jgi:hypothetical protein
MTSGTSQAKNVQTIELGTEGDFLSRFTEK